MNYKRALIGIVIMAITGIAFAAGRSQELSSAVKNVETAKNTEAKERNDKTGKKILIAYFSHTGNTKAFAEEIQKEIGGDLFAIEPQDAYPTDYDGVVRQAKVEVDSGYTPKLKNNAVNTDAYDVIFIGTPVWWYTFAPPVGTFLTEHDLSGKTIVPYSTHKGSGLSGIGGKIKELQPKCNVLEGFAVWHDRAGQERLNIAGWLRGLKL